MNEVWIFNGEKGHFPSAVFSSREKAEKWINDNRLLGTLTKYPVDISVYDWTIQSGFFEPKKPYQTEPKFIGRFSSAYLEHYHFEDETGEE